MPPRPRTRRRLKKRSTSKEEHRQALLAGPVNTTGLPILPAELLLEISAYIPVPPFPAEKCDILPGSYLRRKDVLRALSQTCQSLRHTFLPMAWERIDVCASDQKKECRDPNLPYPPSSLKRELAYDLVRQLEVVTIRDPTLVPCVKVINVIITDYCIKTVIPEFARALALLQNVHTLQIITVPENNESLRKHVMKAFEGYSYPSVRNVTFPASIHNLLKTCPEARSVTLMGLNLMNTSPNYSNWNYWSEPSLCLSHVIKWCPKTERLGGFENVNYCYGSFEFGYGRMSLIDGFLKGLPKTRTVVLCAENHSLSHDIIMSLAKFPELEVIEIYVPWYKNKYLPQNFRTVIQMATDLLRSLVTRPCQVPKRLISHYWDGTQKTTFKAEVSQD